MKIVGQRLRELRQSAKISQGKMASAMGTSQSAVARYESGEAHVPAEIMVKYADFFDVSLDYIFGRTEKPQGRLYEHKPYVEKIYPEMEQFITMCFEPGSAMNKRLKATLMKMLLETDIQGGNGE